MSTDSGGSASHPRAGDVPPNIIFIMPDQWRRDAFGRTNEDVDTPHLDALAARGMVVNGVHCESPVCQPSRASLLTGTWPREHGLVDNELSKWAGGTRFPYAYVPTFPRQLREAGYHTVGLGKLNFWFPQAVAKDLLRGGSMADRPLSDLFGMAHLRDYRNQTAAYGFDEVHEEADKQSLLLFDSDYTDYLKAKGLLAGWRERINNDIGEFLSAYLHGRDASMIKDDAGPPVEPEPLHPDDTIDAYIGRRACEIIENHHETDPLFMWVGFVGPHPPFDTPPPYPDRYPTVRSRAESPEPPAVPDNEWGSYLKWTLDRFGGATFSAADWDEVTRQYYARCSLIDQWVGAIIATLRSRGMDNTWIVFGSDHGELLGDHRMIQKRVFYRNSVEVPAIIAPLTPRDEPTVRDGLFQNLDVTATILDLAGVSGVSGQWHRGESLLATGSPTGREAVFSEIAGFLLVVTEEYKLIVHEPSRTPQSLFALRDDPTESHDVLAQPRYAAVVADLMSRFALPFLSGRKEELGLSRVTSTAPGVRNQGG